MDLEEFVNKVANNLTVVKVLNFFYQNQNTIDNEKGLSVWLNVEEAKLKDVLKILIKYEILKYEFGMYLYRPVEEMKKLIKEFLEYYNESNKEFIDKISKIDLREKELERKIEEMQTMLSEKNRVLFIIQEINNIINSTENFSNILEKLWNVILTYIDVDVISIKYELQNIKGLKIIAESAEVKAEINTILNSEGTCIWDNRANSLMCKDYILYSFNLTGETGEDLGVILFGKKCENKADLERDLELATVISSLITQMLEKQNYFFEKLKKEKLESDLNLAKKIQRSYVPEKFPNIEGFDFAAFYKSARLVGGDYYDWFKIDDNRYSFVVGDVSGKGSAAALFMVKVRENFRIYSRQDIGVEEVLTEINRNLTNDVDVEKFMTAFYLTINFENKKLSFSNAGHDPMFIVRDNRIDEFKIKGLPLGILDITDYNRGETELKKGDIIVLYTDGVVETRNEKREFYGFERFEKVLLENREKTAENIIEAVKDDVRDFEGDSKQHDDFTLLIIKYN